MRPHMAISNFISRCVRGDPPVIYGDGQQTRDFTFIDDVVAANLELLETDRVDGEVLNIGSTDNITITDLAEHVIDEVGVDVEPVYEAEKAADARRRLESQRAHRLRPHDGYPRRRRRVRRVVSREL